MRDCKFRLAVLFFCKALITELGVSGRRMDRRLSLGGGWPCELIARAALVNRAADEYWGRTFLSAQQVEDLVAYLATLR